MPGSPVTALWQRILLVTASPLVFLLLAEGVIRLAGIETDLARNENFEIAVPVWMLSDDNWVDIQRARAEQSNRVPAADVEWLRYFEEARYVQYKLKPNVSVNATNPFNKIERQKGTTFRLESDSDGFRTYELAPKSTGVWRVVTIGDSSTFGWGVDPEYTYQRLLEDRLNDRSPRAEVLNLGISGHTSRHGLAVLDHYGLDLDPDLLIISYGANDARRVLQEADEMLAVEDTWLGAARTFLMYFESFRLLRRVLLSVYDPFDVARARAERDAGYRELVPAVPEEKYVANLRHMIGEGRAAGAPAVLLAVCIPPAYTARMREVAEEEDVPFVDAGKIFRDRLSDLRRHRIYEDEVTFYEKLYGKEAMALSEAIADNGLR